MGKKGRVFRTEQRENRRSERCLESPFKVSMCLIGGILFQKAGLQETDCWLIFLNQVKLGSKLLKRAGERLV